MNLKLLSQILALTATLFSSTWLFAETMWIDVRTSLEHLMDNIDGDIRITHTNILQQASEVVPDKNTQIRLYCRSGRRAEIALSALREAGYTNVINAGSIDDARRERGLTRSPSR